LFRVHLKVRVTDTDAKPLLDPVHFHLHDTLQPSTVAVHPKNGAARYSLDTYGAFTVGVETDRSATHLELDLAELHDAPEEFRRG
jgi:hypothetical protein